MIRVGFGWFFLKLFLFFLPFQLHANPVQKFFNTDVPKMQGCGPGAAIFSSDSWLSTAAATYVNATFSPLLPFTTSSDFSGCKGGPKSIVESQPAFQYLATHFESVTFDIARGEGESVDGLLELLGANKSRRDKILVTLKAGFPDIFRPGGDMYSAYDAIVRIHDQIGESS